MPQQKQTHEVGEANQAAAGPTPRRAPVRRSIILLAVATVALAVFILALGDWRRRHMALDEARWYASELSNRVGEGLALPLNLEIEVPPELRPTLRKFDWLTREEAHRLRAKDGRFIVAQTGEVRQVLGSNGRAVVFFQGDGFECEWLTLAEFDALYATQEEELRRDTSDAIGDHFEGP